MLVLVVGLIHGMVYLFLMPPWQHYDEPNHFEYAWLVAHRGRLPQSGEYDQNMRRETARSMIQHNFFQGLGYLPDLEAVDTPIWIGSYSQLSDPPIYYLLGALAITLAPTQDVAVQLYAVRLVSLFFYLLCIFSAWGIMREITTRDNPLRMLVPLTIALLPGFTDFMTAANNLVAGVGLFSLCLWGCVRLVVRGINIWNILWGAITAGLCLFISPSVYFALPLFLLSLYFGLFRHGKRWISWVILAIGVVIGIALLFSWGDPANWYRSSLQDLPLRSTVLDAVLGDHVFQVDMQGELTQAWQVPTFQSVGYGFTPGEYMFGAWIWSSQPLRIQAPIVGVGAQYYTSLLDIDQNPKFITQAFIVPDGDSARIWVSLAPGTGESKEGIVYYDGLVIANGDRPADEAPVFADPEGRSGIWGGEVFRNWLRNGSAEQAALRFRPWVDRIGSRYIPENTLPSLFLTYLTDWQGVGWLYRWVSENLFRTFWGNFGWGHIPLMGNASYTILWIFSALAVIGVIIWLVIRIVKQKPRTLRSLLPWEVVFLFAMVIGYFWCGAFVRGAPYLQVIRLYVPVARYAYPAIIPTGFLLTLGWVTLLGLVTTPIRLRIRRNDLLIIGIYSSLLLVFAVYSILSIVHYYA